MANIGTLLKAEITRLARKEVKAQIDPLRKANASQRHDIAALKRQIADQQRLLSALGRDRDKSPTPAKTTETAKARFSAKGLKTHRSRLGLSAADYGVLAGVSGQSIYHWESGKSAPRAAQVAVLAGLRGLGKREAMSKLSATRR